jgi:hypothetical protein
MNFHDFKIIHLIPSIITYVLISYQIGLGERNKWLIASTLSFISLSAISGIAIAMRWKFHYGEIPHWIIYKSIIFALLVLTWGLFHKWPKKKVSFFMLTLINLCLMVIFSIYKPL